MNSIGDIAWSYTSTATPKSDAEVDAWDAQVLAREEAERTKRRLAHYAQEVPRRFRDESLDTYETETAEQRDALAAARAFVDAYRAGAAQSLLLCGAVGTGKTHLACGILRETGGVYRLSARVTDELRQSRAFSTSERESDVIARYGSYGLLVLDEVGRAPSASEERYALYQIINERYNAMRPTVFITNMSTTELSAYIGAAAQDRLSGMRVVEFKGASKR